MDEPEDGAGSRTLEGSGDSDKRAASYVSFIGRRVKSCHDGAYEKKMITVVYTFDLSGEEI